MKPGTAKPRLGSQVAAAAQRLPLAGWCLATTLAVILLQLAADSRSLFDTLGDSDDATRLIQIRAFLAGSGWFDTTLEAFGGVEPLNSHWSRLIDAPIAVLIATLQLYFDSPTAEFAARVLWPTLLLLALSYVVARAADVEAGRPAAIAALVLLLAAFLATTQFWIGRIDHHSAMILTAATGVVLLARSFSNSSLAIPAGIALALSLAIGFESLVLIGTALIAFVVIAGVLTRNEDIAEAASIAFATTLLLAAVATVPPARWLQASCDSLSSNLVVVSGLSAAGVWAVLTQISPDHPRLRLLLLAAVVVIAATAGLILEPSCLLGPFGQVDARLNPLWLDHVPETQNIGWLWRHLPAIAITYLVASVFGIAAAGWLALQSRAPAAVFTAIVVTVVALIGLLQVKLIPYAAILTIPPLAIAITRLPHWPTLSRTATQGLALLLSMQIVVSVLAHAAVGVPEATRDQVQADKACRTHDAIRPLQNLPPGLMVSDLNITSAIVADTNLRSYAAPYHRLDKQIRDTAAIFDGTATDARQRLKQIGASYVVVCSHQNGTALSGLKLQLQDDSLRSRLASGDAPDFFTRVKLNAPTTIQVWRIKSETDDNSN